MSEAFTDPHQRARKIASTVRKAIADQGKQVALAAAMGVAESTVSRMQSETLDAFASLLAHCGLKCISDDKVCVSREMYAAMTLINQRAMSDPEVARKLVWEEE